MQRRLNRGRSSFQDKENTVVRQKSIFSPIHLHYPSNFDAHSFNPNIFSSSTSINPFPSNYQTMKLNQKIDHLNQRSSQVQKLCRQEYEEIENILKKSQQDLQKNVESGRTNVEWLLRELKEFVEKDAKVVDIEIIDRLADQIKMYKMRPLLTHLKQNTISSPLTLSTKTSQSIQRKLTQAILPALADQKRQQTQILNNLVTYSNNSLQQLQSEISDINKQAQNRLCMIEDEVEKLQYQVGSVVENMKNTRIREDKFIQQLIQKVIYKMTYL